MLKSLGRSIKVELSILLSASIILGTFFALSTPIGYGNDEMVHAYKGAALSTGQIFPKKILETTSVPLSLVTLATETSLTRAEAICTNISCQKPSNLSEKKLDETLMRSINESSETVNFWGANSYTAIAYIPSAVGFGVSRALNTSVDTAFYLARIMNLIFCSFIAAFAFFILAKSRLRWVIFAIALLPATLLSYSLLGIDGMLNSLALVLVSIVALATLKKRVNQPRYITYVAIAIAILLPLIKLPYVLLSLLIFIPGILHLPKKRLVTQHILIALMILIPALVWNLAVSDNTRTSGILVHAGSTQPNPSKQLKYVFSNPPSFAEAFFKTVASKGVLPSTDNLTHQSGLKLPVDLVAMSLIPLVLSIVYASSEFRRSRNTTTIAIAVLSASVLVVCGIFSALYLGFNPVGSEYIAGVQSRYFIPVYGFVALGLAVLLSLQVERAAYRAKIVFLCLTIAIPVITAIWYINIVY